MFSLWQNYQHQREGILKEKQKHTQMSSLSRDDAA
jgi:hypothetical protein